MNKLNLSDLVREILNQLVILKARVFMIDSTVPYLDSIYCMKIATLKIDGFEFREK